MVKGHRSLKLSEALNFIAKTSVRNWCVTAKIGTLVLFSATFN